MTPTIFFIRLACPLLRDLLAAWPSLSASERVEIHARAMRGKGRVAA